MTATPQLPMADSRKHIAFVSTRISGTDGVSMEITKWAEVLERMGVEILFAEERIGDDGKPNPDGHRRYSVWDAYRNADFVTYPSTYESFGNAFLETVYFRKPILCNRYSIYRTDIEPCGFDVVLMDGFLTDEVIGRVRQVIDDSGHRTRMVEHNYQVARQFFSYDRVEGELQAILNKPRLALTSVP